ncbi:MAG TPA: tetratricopeptide repeat protein [Steroidobacteraceae bacterium]|nr:tetratricopeptide repeat protein [Steroidobacteraceae bacterium]
MHSYSVRDVERVLHLSRSTIQGLIDGGFVKPARGPRRQYQFSFQDLIVLRAARALQQAKVSQKRIKRALKDLRDHLPDEMPLSGISITAVGDRVVVREGKSLRQVDDGQYVLGLDVSVDEGELQVVEVPAPVILKAAPAVTDLVDWFATGVELELVNPRKAQDAYEHAVVNDPLNISAWTNWGRLLHEQGDLKKAESVYRRALSHVEPDSVLMFNLGVLLEDQGRIRAAIEAYQVAVTEDPMLADCHFNLARLYESFGQPQHAIRHLGQYRRLMTSARG